MTIKEIANLAGVSPAAVSLVINNKKGVSDETRKRVNAIIEKYNYVVPNQRNRAKAKLLRLCVVKYLTYGVAIEENQGFIASIIDHIESECRNYGFGLTMVNCKAEKARETIEQMAAMSPDGVIFIGTEMSKDDSKLLDLIQAPTIVLDNSMENVHIDSLVMDNKAILEEAVRYLYGLGYREIGYIRFNLPITNCEERYQGYVSTMNSLGLSVPEPICLSPTLSGAYRDMRQALEEGKFVPHGAYVSDNDTIAIGAMKAIREAGYHIPRDLSIIGVDDIPFSAVTMPALTTMRISRSTLGLLAVDLLRKRIKHPDWPNIHMKISGTLVVRKSTKPLEE